MAMPNPKKYYLVVECTSCARFLLATSNKRTRSCPYCGKRVTLKEAKALARSEDADEARLALQELKIRKHQREAKNDPKLR